MFVFTNLAEGRRHDSQITFGALNQINVRRWKKTVPVYVMLFVYLIIKVAWGVSIAGSLVDGKQFQSKQGFLQKGFNKLPLEGFVWTDVLCVAAACERSHLTGAS